MALAAGTVSVRVLAKVATVKPAVLQRTDKITGTTDWTRNRYTVVLSVAWVNILLIAWCTRYPEQFSHRQSENNDVAST